MKIHKSFNKILKAVSDHGYKVLRAVPDGGSIHIEVMSTKSPKSKPIWLSHVADVTDMRFEISSAIMLEKGDRPGLVHLTEHCLFHDVTVGVCANVTTSDIYKYASANNVRMNAYTNVHGITVMVEIDHPDLINKTLFKCPCAYDFFAHIEPKNNIDAALSILKGLVYTGHVTEDGFKKEVDIVAAEIDPNNSDIDDIIAVDLSMTRTGYTSVSGLPSDVRRYTIDDVKYMTDVFRANVTCGSITTDMHAISIPSLLDALDRLSDVLTTKPRSVYDNKVLSKRKEFMITNITPLMRATTSDEDRFEVVTADTPKPYIIITWPNTFLNKMESDSQLLVPNTLRRLLVGGLNSHLYKTFRETYGRCYSISALLSPIASRSLYIIGNQTCAAGLVYDNILDKGKLTAKCIATIKKEVSEVMNSMEFSDDTIQHSINTTITSRMDYKQTNPIYVNRVLLSLGKIGTGVFTRMDAADPTTITVEDVKKGVESIKNGWKCRIVKPITTK